MKRLIALFVLLCLVLCACGNNTPAETTGTPAESTAETTVETTTPETTAPVVYHNPLNGEVLDAPYTGTPVAVAIGNTKSCLPQYGINDASIIYEIETEGGITRCLAIFSDISQAEAVGPVRSARTFFNNVAASYGAPIVHCGGSDRGINGGYEDSDKRIPDWEHVNEQFNGKYFYRDKDEHSTYQGYATEHTLFAKGEKLAQAMEDKGYNNSTSVDFGIAFADVVVLGGETAETVTITFRGGKTTKMTYDAATGLYTMHQYGDTTIDGLTKEATTFKNVISLATDQWNVRDTGYSRSYYQLTETEGVGTLAIDGQIVPIKWARDGLTDHFTYTLEDGTPITLAAGRTYVAIVGDTDTPAVYE